MSEIFKIEDLQRIFNETFQEEYRTILKYGADEPFYKSAKSCDEYHQIYCRSDFFASALHEIGHWCIAGKKRRDQDDFGYWYSPDGRSLQEQFLFEKYEVKPQALEWTFSLACNYPFKISIDNLSLSNYDSTSFRKKVHDQLQKYKKIGLPDRAEDFVRELQKFYSF